MSRSPAMRPRRRRPAGRSARVNGPWPRGRWRRRRRRLTSPPPGSIAPVSTLRCRARQRSGIRSGSERRWPRGARRLTRCRPSSGAMPWRPLRPRGGNGRAPATSRPSIRSRGGGAPSSIRRRPAPARNPLESSARAGSRGPAPGQMPPPPCPAPSAGRMWRSLERGERRRGSSFPLAVPRGWRGKNASRPPCHSQGEPARIFPPGPARAPAGSPTGDEGVARWRAAGAPRPARKRRRCRQRCRPRGQRRKACCVRARSPWPGPPTSPARQPWRLRCAAPARSSCRPRRASARPPGPLPGGGVRTGGSLRPMPSWSVASHGSSPPRRRTAAGRSGPITPKALAARSGSALTPPPPAWPSWPSSAPATIISTAATATSSATGWSGSYRCSRPTAICSFPPIRCRTAAPGSTVTGSQRWRCARRSG